MKRNVIIRLAAGAVLVSHAGAVYAQQTCVDPTTQQADTAATTAWLADVANANAELMTNLAGTWVGPPELGDPRSTLTVAYAADGTLTFALHQCGEQAIDPCLDVDGTGAWAAYPSSDGTFHFGRFLIAPGILEGLCQSNLVTLTDPNTVTTAEGLIITRTPVEPAAK